MEGVPAWGLAAVEPGGRSRSVRAGQHRSEADDVTLLQTIVGARGAGRDQLAAVLREGRLLLPDGDPEQSARHHGWSRGQVKRLRAFCQLARRCLIPPDSAAPAVTSPKEALFQFQDLRRGPSESFAVLYLNARNQPLGREVVAVVLAHNHPSGDPTPSPEDLAVTRHLLEAGELLGVEVLDHLVLSADRFQSIREAGGL